MAERLVAFPGLWGLVLAAGLSRRAAPHNKLLLQDASGRALVRIVAEAFVQTGLEGVLVVTGHQREAILQALEGLPVREIWAADYAGGMGCSLAAGIRSLPAGVRGVLVSPADLPGMHPELIRKVARDFELGSGLSHVIPSCNGERGHPVALGAWLLGELAQLGGDSGARQLLSRQAERVRTRVLETKDPGACRDRDLAF